MISRGIIDVRTKTSAPLQAPLDSVINTLLIYKNIYSEPEDTAPP
jgi:hypothetical protein